MTLPPSYAPTNTTSYGPANENHINYHQEITRSSIANSPQKRQVYEDLAEIFSILQVLETVEKSFIKDYITNKDKYTSTVLRFINQYSIIFKGLEAESVKPIVMELLPELKPDFSNFLILFQEKFNLNCPLSNKRLEAGVPATIENSGTKIHSSSDGGTKSARLIAEATGNYITCMDALKLNYRTKSQLHPLLSNLVVSLNDLVVSKTGEAPQSIDFAGKSKLVSWLIKLNGLAENEELDDNNINQFLEDLESAYKGFYTSLED